jgi:ABC-type transport system involved in Fe-S cluster assembly fused permease/ATPase subunit
VYVVIVVYSSVQASLTFVLCIIYFILLTDSSYNDTKRQVNNHDKDVDVFLIFEEVGMFDGKSVPPTKKDLCEFLQEQC